MSSLYQSVYQQQQHAPQPGMYPPYPTAPQPQAHYLPAGHPYSAPIPQPGQMPPQQPVYSPPPPTVIAAPPPTPQDYYKGFYEGVVRNSGGSSAVGSVMSWVGPLLVNTAFFLGPIWLLRRNFARSASKAATSAAGAATKEQNPLSGMMDMFNPMKAKNFRSDVKGTTFKDVIGIPEAKEDLQQYVDFLSNPKKFTKLGARLPKGCLLTGKPGTGKTLLAKAIAGESKTAFFSCSGADFIEIFGGSGPKRVRELFSEAKESTPCVVFIDEIDAIGSRSSVRSMGGGSSEENRTINQLLAELDGLSSSQAIVVIAATNYPEAVDKALLREGRFDRKVNIPMPDQAAREELFQYYLEGVITGDPACKPKDTSAMFNKKKDDNAEKTKEPEQTSSALVVLPDVSNKAYAKELATRTPGVTPAQINTIVNEAALQSAVNGDQVVVLPNLHAAIDDVLIGKKHRQRMGAQSLKRTAVHECGHTLMAWFLPLQKDVVKVSVVPRGRAGGYTQQVQDEAQDPQTEPFLFSQLCVLLGGRASERLLLGDVSTGALDDLQRATKIAMGKLLQFGMSKRIGHLSFKVNEKQDGRAWMTFSEELHASVEEEARELVNRAFQHCLNLLTAKKEKLEELAATLLDKKELSMAEIEGVLGKRITP